ncbi:hypothetical protein [Streptomyces litchfieldiae]|uniref:Integral membrane protein n=1 Tax=Streptomyces litchfieldiae TaxID=3075543 RepID=A0ABU2MXT3_9ACTN|nr:hypothetical protein [Streptomyces sp. DSM 44938]MDT0346477.1 hypothetical protein [Streptomyces sp. DSM 44938]
MDRTANRRWNTGLALFGEVVITGALVALLALPVVTALPALAAGTAHLRRHLSGDSVRVAELLRDFAAACRALWLAGLAFTGVALVLLWNLSLAQAGVIPGSGGMQAVTLVLLAAWAVLLLRTAAVWRPGADAAGAVREAVGRAREDVAGSVLLAFGWALCAVFVWMLLPLFLLTGGLLALAAVAVEARAAARAEPADPDA